MRDAVNTTNRRPRSDMVEQISQDTEYMQQAVDLLESCVSESGKLSPSVSAVVVQDGIVLASAYRGELGKGEHAEYTVLERKLKGMQLKGATMYTTLEPCISRNHPKKPCVEWLIQREIKEVVVGILDPNPCIYNRGCDLLRNAGMRVRFFTKPFRDAIENANRNFIE